MPYRVCKSFEVQSGHMLSRHPSLCRFPHGHSRRIDVVLVGESLDDSDMLCDFKAVKLAVRDFVRRFDHALAINSEDPLLPSLSSVRERLVVFENQDPTTEAMAKMIFDFIAAELKAGKTYTDSDASGKVVGQGTWAVKDGKTCFMATKGDSGCYTEAAPGADGSFTATSEKGDTVTVKPIVLTAADMAGTYDFMMDGKATTSVMKGDGSYEDSAGGKVTESGTWTANNGKVCFQDTAHKNPEQCWTTTKMDANGKFAATSTDGKTVLQITKQKT